MAPDITLVIPTHNRHHYLKRVLEYYNDIAFKIIVADSSTNAYDFVEGKMNIFYLHVPGKNLTEKLSDAFDIVTTEFVFMCADDDFIIPESVAACVDFLKQNEDFSAADGNIIYYKKESLKDKIVYSPVYEPKRKYDIIENNSFERVQLFFQYYRTIFYAVHRTKFLKIAFNAAKGHVKNLYLNEYVTCLLPVMCGKYKQLPVLYQVREFDENSDDKRTANLDAVITDSWLKEQYNNLLKSQSEVIAKALNINEKKCESVIDKVMMSYAEKLPTQRNLAYNGIDKKIGFYIKKFPFAGKKIISLYRKYKQQKKLLPLIRKNDKKCLKKIDQLIIKYQGAIQ